MPRSSTSAALSIIPGGSRPDDDDSGLIGAIKYYINAVVSPLREKLLVQEAEIQHLKTRSYENLPLAIDQAGVLVLAKSDGSMRDLGIVVGRDGKDGLSTEDLEATLAPIREQLLVQTAEIEALKARQPAPGRDGLPGAPGPAGRDGRDGAPGADGLGFDDWMVEHDGDRRITFRFARGEKVKEFKTVWPTAIYRGVHKEGGVYERGDTVTWAGCTWHCNEPTITKPGQSNKAWTMCVKAGRDGKDGKGEKGEKGDPGRPGRDLTHLGGVGR